MPYCQHCGTFFEESKEKTLHVRTCPQNPKVIKKLEEMHYQSEAEAEYREFVNSVYNYEDIFINLDAYLFKRGLRIEFSEKPSKFELAIKSDFFKQPKMNQNKDMIYSGWTGSWAGQIYKLDGTKAEESFWDINGEMNGKWNLLFLRSGSGSWSAKFSGIGTIFVEDFPHLFEKYIKQGFNARYNTKVSEEISSIVGEIKLKETDLIKHNIELVKMTNILESIRVLESQIRKGRDLHTSKIREKFRSELTIDLPEIEMPFINMDKYNAFKNTYKKPCDEETSTVDLIKFSDNLKKIQKEAEASLKDYAEYFI